jgi:hypothetical protein
MDGFYAFCMWTAFVAFMSFATGKYFPATDIRKDCGLTGETIISKTVIKCKPVAAIVDGHRVNFEEKE